MGGVVYRLEATRPVTRETNSRDRRARELRLTPEGTACAMGLGPCIDGSRRAREYRLKLA